MQLVSSVASMQWLWPSHLNVSWIHCRDSGQCQKSEIKPFYWIKKTCIVWSVQDFSPLKSFDTHISRLIFSSKIPYARLILQINTMQIPHWEQSIEAMSPFVKNLFENIITLSCPKTSFISTSNYRRKRRLHGRMSIILSSIIEVSMNKIKLWICVGVDDWTVKRAIIASYGK